MNTPIVDQEKLLQDALATINKLNERLESFARNTVGKDQGIAIIGMACRFPGADNLKQFWSMLLQRYDAVGHYPKSRFDLLQSHLESFSSDIENIHGSYLKGVELFDAGLFHISPREAKCMDPQQRMLLMMTHQALVDAGISNEPNFGRTGVFVSHYASQYLALDRRRDPENALFMATGNAASISANRISYHYDLQGPSLVLDTACSSSLASLEIACRYLRDGNIDYAIVGAVSLNLNMEATKLLQHANMLSPDGRCKTFDSRADGYVPGEGVGVIVLRRTADPPRPNEKIYAVIKGCCINHDGRSNGLTAPNGLAQEAVIKAACREAKVVPATLGYVETHGTGTYLGDPVEIEALGNVVGVDRGTDRPCILGCLKTNIGHLEPAAGIASIIKASLCIFHGIVPGNNHLQTVNPLLNIERYGFRLPEASINWSEEPRTAGVSCFGFGGVNGFAVLASAPVKDAQHWDLESYPLWNFDLKPYWHSPPSESPISPAVSGDGPRDSFLAYERVASPIELLRASFMIKKGDLAGIEDTGNFHIGFYLEALYKVFADHLKSKILRIDEIGFLQPLQVSRQMDTEIQILIRTEGERYLVEIYFRYVADHSRWALAARATVAGGLDAQRLAPVCEPQQMDAPLRELDEATFYRHYESMGMPGRGYVRAIQYLRLYQSDARASLRPAFDASVYRLGAHPGLLDAVVQPAFLLLDPSIRAPYMTTSMKDVTLYQPLVPSAHYELHSRLLSVQDEQAHRFSASWTIHDRQGRVFMDCRFVHLQRISRGATVEQLPQGSTVDAPALLRFIAERLDTSPENVDSKATLPELGMDSLMMMRIRAMLDQSGRAVPDLFQVTVSDLMALFAQTPPQPSEEHVQHLERYGDYAGHVRRTLLPHRLDKDRWLRGQETPASRIRLYCFAHGHLSAVSVFKDWVKHFPEHIQVVPVELPGHGDRIAERPIESLDELAHVLAKLIQEDAQGPFALFGHSSGALLAYVLAQRFTKNGSTLPARLIVSAFSAPTIAPNPVIASALETYHHAGIDHIPSLSDILDPANAALVGKVIGLYHQKTKAMGLVDLSPDIVAAQLHAIVAIMRAVSTFDPAVAEALPIPLVAFHGEQDRQVSLAEMQAWEALAGGGFSLATFPGDHLFIHPQQSQARVIASVQDLLDG